MTEPTPLSDNCTGDGLERPSEHLEQARLVESGRAVADLAHLAKNILQVLSGCSEIIDLALKTDQFDRVRQAWQLYQPNFQRLKKFQLDLINYTKSYPPNPQPCDLKGVIESSVKQMKPFFVRRNVDFVCCLDTELGTIVADGEKLRDAVINLLVVAVDNLQDEPGQVRLDAWPAQGEQAVCIRVSDSGPRLDAAMLAALYGPHERCRNMLGTGLEIPLTKEVIDAHSGSLDLYHDAAEGGNTSLMTLPA